LPTHSGNSATKYGANYGSFSQNLKSLTEAEYNSQIAKRRSLTSTLSGTTSLTLSSQQSGGTLPTIYLSLVDQYGQIVGSDSSSTATLSLVSTTGTYTPTLTGTVTQTANNGVFKFEGITFTAEPGQSYSKTSS
jgi:hypothetical protein